LIRRTIKREESIVKSPDLTRIPAELRSNGDPIERNPYPNADPRHQVWDRVTRIAEEKLCRVNSKFLKGRPTLNQGIDAAWIVDFTLEKFDIWARRGIEVVRSDPAAQAFSQWLVNYAEGWLTLFREDYPGFIRADYLLPELRLGLTERVEYWKSQAFRCLAEQQVHDETVDAGADLTARLPHQAGTRFLNATDTPRTPEPSAVGDSDTETVCQQQTGDRIIRTESPGGKGRGRDSSKHKTEAREAKFPVRALWLKERLDERAWNKHDVSRHSGPNHKSVQKILDGYSVREDLLEKLANALSQSSSSQKRSAVNILDIPRS
jgi:hypothetical protein